MLVTKTITHITHHQQYYNSECQDFWKIYRNYELSCSYLLFLFSFPSHTDLNAYVSRKPGNAEVNKLESLSIKLTLQCNYRHLEQSPVLIEIGYKVLWNLKEAIPILPKGAECFFSQSRHQMNCSWNEIWNSSSKEDRKAIPGR